MLCPVHIPKVDELCTATALPTPCAYHTSRVEIPSAVQERTAKRAKLKEEDASAYIQASTLPDGGDDTAPAVAAITKDAKVLQPSKFVVFAVEHAVQFWPTSLDMNCNSPTLRLWSPYIK